MSLRPAPPESDVSAHDRPHAPIVVIIVGRGETALHRYIVRTFERQPEVGVMLDRRHGERRRGAVVPPVERRCAERRSPQSAERLKAQGWLIMRARRDPASR